MIVMQKYDVIIFMGQSNMQGESERLPDDNAPIKGALEYRYLTNCLVELKNPVGECIRYDGSKGFEECEDMSNQKEWLAVHALGASSFGYANMVPSFCRSYIAESGRNVIAIHAARGCTSISRWLPQTPIYEMAVQKVDLCLKSYSEMINDTRISVVWLQGESDAKLATTKEDYKEKLRVIKDDLKLRFGVSKFGIIKVGAFTNDCRDQVIFDAQEEVCKEDSDFVMITRITEQLVNRIEYMNPKDPGHFNCAGLELIGETAGRNLAKIQKGE